MRRAIVALATLLAGLVVLSGVGVVLAYAGLVPVAASAHHSGPVEELFEAAFDHAVERGAKDLTPPADVDSPEMQRIGLLHYQDVCATCHGAPGVEPSEIGQGLYPQPPLLERKKHARVAETFWVIKNGVRDTGMPSFGATYTDRQIWAIAGFAVAMAHMPPEEYARRLAELEAGGSPVDEGGAGDAHEPGAGAGANGTKPASTPHGSR